MNSTSYQPVHRTDQDRAPEISQTALRRRRSWTKLPSLVIYFNLFLSLLWLAPIATLLYFNFSGYVIGASVWCPHGGCNFNPFAANAFATANQYNHEAHNLLGGLQLVAKALEVWFVFVAAGLVYIVANWLATRPSGLPLALHCSHVEFSDLRLLLDREFWRAPQAVGGAMGQNKRKPNWLLYGFILFCAIMCLLANLMGPAVAVLVLPTLQQIETKQVPERVFLQIDSDVPPAGNSSIPYCTQENYDDEDYSCTYYAYGTALDSWIASGKAYDYQIPYVISRWPNGTDPASNAFAASQALFAVSQEWAVSFAFNASTNDDVFFAPNRQVLRNMTGDLENFYETITGNFDDFSPQALRKNQDPVLASYIGSNDNGFVPQGPDSTFEQLKSSLQTTLQRNGPVIGANINFYQASGWAATAVSEDQLVLCGQGWSPLSAADATWNGTKCLPIGTGWPNGKDQSVVGDYLTTIPFLGIFDEQLNFIEVNMTVGLFWANQAAYFNETSNNQLAQQLTDAGCLSSNYSFSGSPTVLPDGANCDWDAFFDQPPPDTQYPYILDNVHTILIEMSGLATENAVDRFVIEFSPNSSIAQYTLDTSPFTNAIRLVEVVNPDVDHSKDEPVYIHPSWLAAMFSAYNNSGDPNWLDAENETANYISFAVTNAPIQIAQIVANLTASFQGAHDLFSKLQTGGPRAHDLYRNIFYTTYLTTLHLCSMLSFSTDPVTDAALHAEDKSTLLSRQASVSVWAYGIDSRTSAFGTAITIMGIVVVLAYVILGLVTRTRVKGPTELLAAALAQDHKAADPYAEVNGDDDLVGRVRYSTARTGTDLSFKKVNSM